MKMSPQIASMILSSSTDADLVCQAAESLGDAASYTTPKVAPTPEWAIKVQAARYPVELRCWAARHCTDTAARNLIAKKTARLDVAVALARGADDLDETSIAKLRALAARRSSGYRLEIALTERDTGPVDIKSVLSLFESTSPPKKISRSLVAAVSCATPAQREDLLARAIKAKSQEIVFDYFRHHAGGQDADLDWAGVTFDINNLSRIDEDTRDGISAVLEGLISDITGSSSIRLGPPAADLIMRLLDPDSLEAAITSYYSSEFVEVFTPAAVDMLLANPAFAHALSHHPLTKSQFEFAINNLTPTDLVRFFVSADTPTRTMSFLNALSASPMTLDLRSAIDDTNMIEEMRESYHPKSPAILATLALLADDDEVASYIDGTWSRRANLALPTRAQIDSVISHHDVSRFNWSVALEAELNAAPVSYQRHLINVIPGEAWRYLDNGDALTGYIYDSLAATGDIRLAIDQLECHQGSSLSEVVAATSMLVRSNAA